MNYSRLAVLSSSLLLAACGACPPGSATSVPQPGSIATFAQQVEWGSALYAENCAGCHGGSGEGTGNGPAVVGAGALPLDPPSGAKHRTAQFRTAADVATFVVQTMPPGDAGQLSQDEYVAILAFALKANGVEREAPLTGEAAAEVVLHK